MTDDSKVGADSPSPDAAQREWASKMSKVLGGGGVAVKAKAAPGGAGAPAPGGPGAPAPDKCVTPDATASDYFFDFNSSDLTASDKTYLEAYAKAYLAQNIAEKIKVTGYASIEGDKRTNDTLSLNRADKVVRYLIAQKVPKEKVDMPVGKGATSSFPGDLCQNRRVQITPVLELKVSDFVGKVEIEPIVPTGKKPAPSLGEKAPEPSIPDPPEPCPMASLEVVEDALKDWLIALGQAQKIKTKDKDKEKVLTTYRVHMAELTLLGKIGDDGDTREGPHGRRCGREDLEREPITPFNGDGKEHDADALAKEITKNYPKRLSHQNLLNLLNLPPTEAKGELSYDEQIRKKADSAANQVLSDIGVPKKYWKDVKDWVKKKIPVGIEKLPGLDDKTKELLKKGYDKLANPDGEK